MRPLLVVPGLFSTEIYDDDLGYLWGRFRNLYGGPPLATLGTLRGRPRELLRGLPLVVGLSYDLLGALERALQAGGYRTGETLHFFAYDFRQRVLDLAPMLAAEIRRLAGAAGGPIDLLGLSNGGLVDPGRLRHRRRRCRWRRVVTSGTPNAGIIETLTCIDRGFSFAPLGRLVTPEEFMACPNALESIPSPRTAVLPDRRRPAEPRRLRPLRRRHLAAAADVGVPTSPGRSGLDRGRHPPAGRRARDLAPVRAGGRRPRRLICICGSGLPTQVGIVVRDGKPFMPGEGNVAGVPRPRSPTATAR